MFKTAPVILGTNLIFGLTFFLFFGSGLLNVKGGNKNGNPPANGGTGCARLVTDEADGLGLKLGEIEGLKDILGDGDGDGETEIEGLGEMLGTLNVTESMIPDQKRSGFLEALKFWK